jgi:hypothetical protein
LVKGAIFLLWQGEIKLPIPRRKENEKELLVLGIVKLKIIATEERLFRQRK